VVAGYAAIAADRQQREYDKFVTDSEGKTCILVTVVE
jgi:hypothetical protein